MQSRFPQRRPGCEAPTQQVAGSALRKGDAMGEYWKPVNVTRGEWIHPHHVGSGLKLGEWNYNGSPVLDLIDKLLEAGSWSRSDDVRAVSDYGNEIQLFGNRSDTECPYDDVEESFREVRVDSNRTICGDPGSDFVAEAKAPYPPSLLDFFAAAAMQGLIASDMCVDAKNPDQWDAGVAERAYKIANAMLAEKVKG